MPSKSSEHQAYFSHLQKISLFGRVYKRLYALLILFICEKKYGKRLVEIGAGTGNGILGASPKHVLGLDINPLAVKYCQSRGFKMSLINEGGDFPIANKSFDACVLDNVLEHIKDPQQTLDECYRVTKENGGLVVIVPGVRGYDTDSDHKVYYDRKALEKLDERWAVKKIFSIPLFIESGLMSKTINQYCLVAIYTKK